MLTTGTTSLCQKCWLPVRYHYDCRRDQDWYICGNGHERRASLTVTADQMAALEQAVASLTGITGNSALNTGTPLFRTTVMRQLKQGGWAFPADSATSLAA